MASSSDCVIRLAREDDLSSLASVWHDSWQYGHASLQPEAAEHRDLQYFQARIASILGRGALAQYGDRIVGFTSWQGDGIAQCFVLPDMHGKGVAPLLLVAAENALRIEGHKRIWLYCQEGNVRARSFYEKQGWHVAATVDNEIGTNIGWMTSRVWRMEKDLTT